MSLPTLFSADARVRSQSRRVIDVASSNASTSLDSSTARAEQLLTRTLMNPPPRVTTANPANVAVPSSESLDVYNDQRSVDIRLDVGDCFA